MTINWWTLGLQAINVLILVWLLSRVFWQPVAAAIARRQEAANKLTSDAEALKTKADTALADIAKTRAGFGAERDDVLAKATKQAEAAAKAAQTEASDKAAKLVDAARVATEKAAGATRAAHAAEAAVLAVDIAGKLLGRLGTDEVQTLFLSLLTEAIGQLSAKDRAAVIRESDMDVVSARDLTAADKAAIQKAIWKVLSAEPALNFKTEPDLIAGFELRSAHFDLRNSWRSDLDLILKGVSDAA